MRSGVVGRHGVTLLAALAAAGCGSQDITAPTGTVWDVTYTVTTVGDLRADTITYANGTFRLDGAEVPAVEVHVPKVWSRRVFLPDSAVAWISVDYGSAGGGSLTFDITYQRIGHPERVAAYHDGPLYFDALPRPTHVLATGRFLALADVH